MKNPQFVIVCMLIAVTPLFRGAVHAWAQTVIQIMVAVGLLLVVFTHLKGEKRRKKNKQGQDCHRVMTQPHGRQNPNAITRLRINPAPRLFVWWVIVPVASLGVWSTAMSPHPALAQQGLIMLMTYLGFFWLVMVSITSRKEQRTLVWVVVGTATFLSVVGLLKQFDILTFTWWDYALELKRSHGTDRLSGVYVNANHMAGFLEMAIPMMLVLFLTRSRSPEALIGMGTLTLFLLVCQALTLSRGGWAGTVGSLLFMAIALLFKKGFMFKRQVVTLLISIVAATLIVISSTDVVERIITLTQGEIEESLTGRLTYWAGTRNMIADNLVAGTGPGTFSVAFPPYQVPGLAVLPRYAHSDYLQFPAEAGILIIPLMITVLYLFFRVGFVRFQSHSRQTSGIALGCMAAVVAILIHSCSDGNLQIPANALLFTSLCALTLSR